MSETRAAYTTQSASDRAEAILAAIRDYTADHGYAPAVRDLQAACGHSSTSVTAHWLKQLKRAGRITWEPHVARSIRLVEAEDDVAALRAENARLRARVAELETAVVRDMWAAVRERRAAGREG